MNEMRSADLGMRNEKLKGRTKQFAIEIFISKMGIVEEEADESLYWLELLLEARLVSRKQIEHLMTEGNEITAMVVASIKTARRNRK